MFAESWNKWMNAELLSMAYFLFATCFFKIIYNQMCSLWIISPTDFSVYGIPFFFSYTSSETKMVMRGEGNGPLKKKQKTRFWHEGKGIFTNHQSATSLGRSAPWIFSSWILQQNPRKMNINLLWTKPPKEQALSSTLIRLHLNTENP